jgi:hypothetical protein
MTTMQRPEEEGATAVRGQPVALVDRDEYHALLAEREFLSTAFVRQRVVTIVGAFTLAIAASLTAFLGGFWVGQRINDESFKAACSRVVDETMKNTKTQGNRTLQVDGLPPDQAQKVSH